MPRARPWAFLALVLLPAVSQAQIAGDYVGNLSCRPGAWNRAELRIETRGKAEERVSALLTLTFFSNAWGIPRTAVEMKGGYSKVTEDLELSAKKWLGPVPKGWDALRLTASYKSDRIHGHTGITSCNFTFLRTGTAPAEKMRAELERRQAEQAALERRDRTAPEWRETESEVSDWEGGFEYVDAGLTPAGWSNIEVEPVDEAHQGLHDAGLKCLVTSVVRWQGSQGGMRAEHFDTKWHVIECRGNCKGLRYEIEVPTGLVFHQGLSTAVPVLMIRSPLRDLAWRFTRTETRDPAPEVRVHTWTKSFGDQGPGCRLF